MQPRVHNKRAGTAPAGAVYIGRPSKWGNPFHIGKDGNRAQVIKKYERHVRSTPGMIEEIQRDLRGKHLVCWCAPADCHGDVLLRIANAIIWPETECVCVGHPEAAHGCVCPPEERALRAWMNGKEMPPMTDEQRQWCVDEIGKVEGYETAGLYAENDADLARTVIDAWVDYCRDKGLM